MSSFSANWYLRFGTRRRELTGAGPSGAQVAGRLEQTEFHKVYLARLEGNTLVVTPRGDAIGFRDSDVANELRTLLGLAGLPGIVNLIVDLGSSNYFGKVMMNNISQLGEQFQKSGGRIALCEVSEQMTEMLRIMRLTDSWMTFDTRKTAVKAMRKV
jgi:anti-anti-sigma regulatory factor